MELEKIPTVPTADEILDRSFRRAAAKRREKINKDRANEEFVRSVASSVHDRLGSVVRAFPSFDQLPLFYRDLADILFSVDRLKKSLGAVMWAAEQARTVGYQHARSMRHSADTPAVRKQAVARISSIVHQVDGDLRFLNDARNVLRKLPEVKEDEFTVVVGGYPNVGKSSFIRLVSTAEPEVASYPFTTRGIIVGHRAVERERMQFIDTPGVLERPAAERNPIERQAVSALINVADAVLFILDASEECGYALEAQLRLLDEVRQMVDVPVVPVVNKADIRSIEGYPAMSTKTGEGIEEVLAALLRYKTPPSR
ncbi:MAG: 50S ribosome-binding GTPase [Methanomicrobiaceae archaeon]|uniref:Gtp-binding protein, gtp1/obg family n=1 Tax=hydrocarbon metagenome TaxID=938273 RepID=A0A0W8FDS2_9ZZZZ|nr:50S ribosome-binding GTPase [Methanomicrobiaceae archaeon]